MNEKRKTSTTMAAAKILKKIQKLEAKTDNNRELGVLRHIDDILRGIVAGEKVSIAIGTHSTITYECGTNDTADVKTTTNFTDIHDHDDTVNPTNCHGDNDTRTNPEEPEQDSNGDDDIYM